MSSDCSLELHRNRLSIVSDETFVATYESFLHELAAGEGLLAGLRPDELYTYATFFSQCQRRYLALKEKETYEQMMAVMVNGGVAPAIEKICKGFGRDAYQRVSDLIDLIDPATCNNVVMVGSGAFPATLFWLHDHFPGARYTGLDIDARCIDMANDLKKAMNIKDMEFKVVDGRDYDYDAVDFVYLANQVVPKKAVLEQVSRSVSVAQVVVREPTRRGALLAEAVRHDLPPEFLVRSQGTDSSVFLSFDLSLKRI